jgi:tripartite-type tricarboxylate transporter receptor subunit TctC
MTDTHISITSTRRHALATAAALVASTVLPVAHAQSGAWPNRPVKMVVGFPGGSSPDLTARLLAEPLSQALG